MSKTILPYQFISLFQSNVIQEKLLGIVYKSSNETPLKKIVFPYKVKFKGGGVSVNMLYISCICHLNGWLSAGGIQFNLSDTTMKFVYILKSTFE